MPTTLNAGQSASLSLDGWQYVTITTAPNSEGDFFVVPVAAGSVQNTQTSGRFGPPAVLGRQFGPYGCPVILQLNCRLGSLSYDASQSLVSGAGIVAGLVAGDATKATANAAAINALTALGGPVVIPGGLGVVYFNDTIVGGQTPTALQIGRGTTLTAVPKTAGGTTFPAIANSRLSTSRSTLSSVTGTLVGTHSLRLTFTFAAAHRCAAGGALYLNGDTSEIWNGFWPVESVTSSTALTVLTAFPNPTAGYVVPSFSGTVLGCPADVDFQVFGPGTIDMNFLNGGFTAAGDYRDHCIVVNNALRPVVDGVRVINARKYCVCFQNCDSPVARNIEGHSNSDGVHVYGPVWNALTENITGEFGDDAAIFQCVDGPTFLGYHLPEPGRSYPGGNIYNGVQRRILPRWTGNSGACVLYPNAGIDTSGGSGYGYTWTAGDLGYRMKGQQVIDVTAQQFNAGTTNFYSSGGLNVGNGYVATAGYIESLIVRAVQWSGISLKNAGGGQISIDTLVLEHVGTDTYTGVSQRIYVDKMTINNLVMEKPRFKCKDGTSGEVFNFQSSNAIVNNLTINQGVFDGGSTGPFPVVYAASGTGAQVKNITFNQPTVTGSCQLVKAEANGCFAGTPVVTVNGGNLAPSSSTFGVAGTQTMDFKLSDVRLVSGAIFNAYGSGKVRVWAKGVSIDSGSVALNLSSGNVCEWFNPDGSLPVDITKLARTRNQMAMHNGATAAGTIVANNLCIADSTQAANGWKQLSNTANVY